MYRLRVFKATRCPPAGGFTTSKSQKCVDTHSDGVQVASLDAAIIYIYIWRERERERERERQRERQRDRERESERERERERESETETTDPK